MQELLNTYFIIVIAHNTLLPFPGYVSISWQFLAKKREDNNGLAAFSCQTKKKMKLEMDGHNCIQTCA
jgi:hypothetical protein